MIAARAARKQQLKKKEERRKNAQVKKEGKQPDDTIPDWILEIIDERTQLFLRKHFYARAESGLLDNSSVIKLLRESGLNPTDFRCHDLLKEFDSDGDGVLSFTEYINMFTHLRKEEITLLDTMDLFKKGFHFMDKDGNNRLDRDELKTIMQGTGDILSDEEFNEFLNLIDKNGAGDISWDEFQEFFEEDRSSYTKYYVAECERLENNVKTGVTLFKVDSKAYGSRIASPNNTSLPPWQPRTSSDTTEYPAASEGCGQGIFSGLMHALAAPFSSCFNADEISEVETLNDKMRITSDVSFTGPTGVQTSASLGSQSGPQIMQLSLGNNRPSQERRRSGYRQGITGGDSTASVSLVTYEWKAIPESENSFPAFDEAPGTTIPLSEDPRHLDLSRPVRSSSTPRLDVPPSSRPGTGGQLSQSLSIKSSTHSTQSIPGESMDRAVACNHSKSCNHLENSSWRRHSVGLSGAGGDDDSVSTGCEAGDL
eukprot:CAMPEP_0198204142 /NCGR_PEP_ID=MMETSP1445-20131203/7524_1 /TAXON_ID=36898 /ORGANISM="Pyramimonas sp., Strain CCMP2087" /LENGTH=482 /DNA_ID=CAMNT_0043875883 /DNA_START=225 /DNA_END=1670 /DNA_ORIENTATION=-